MAPMAIGALALLVLPGHAGGMVAVVASTIAVAWYLLGGAVSVGHLARGIVARRSLSRIRAEVLASSEPVWICDPMGVVQLQNDAATVAHGDLTGQRVQALAAGTRADADGAVADMILRAGRIGSSEMTLADGNILSVTVGRDAPLQIWTISGAQPDIAPHAPDRVNLMAEPYFDNLPVALLKLDRDGRVHRANQAACRLVPELDQHPLLGSLMEGPGRSVGDWVADVCEGRTSSKAEMLRLREGAERYFQVSLAPDSSDPASVLAVLHDASALKTLEAQFVQSQKMQAIGQLAGGVAHDFNNLLTAITGHCDLLMLRHDKADPDYADLDQISQNANRAAALVSQLLAFSRKQTLKPQIIDLRDTLADLRHLLNRLVGERIALSIHHAPDLRAIRADKRQLEQVIMNLVVNARDAMKDGGDIQVRTRNLHYPQGHVQGRVSLPPGRYVEVQVQDEGTGIAPEIAEKIFEPFFTTKRTGEGTGLGLSTAYGIVKQTGGYIFCDSTLGEGTCFTLLFPAYDRRESHTPAELARPLAPAPEPTRPATVLLVEDEAAVRAFAARALRMKGYEVLEAASAEAALELLADDRLSVDVFVTDVVMPGMDGPSWVRTALVDRPQTRVVFMSGYTEDIFGEGHAPVPNSVFLAKPFTLAELTEVVARHLSGQGPVPH
ncbi:MAG: ATP-binding protein [Paracoccus sp. (in: a-proteobacteria)]|uniref:hybrid sensor histidine kinase/response regulator n=1 Tax=Paracoccus sp. TaxID=267 RepID=UPI0026E0D115|nr:ATP-binding protein [Paracoccus sp. (in: a-proteobacteria)]MDO5632465.1 ATP-binding protein [Paracoccus sp. (in: a-proteobacteria)]